jgi:3-hydroxybutyrate dehydrogenase
MTSTPASRVEKARSTSWRAARRSSVRPSPDRLWDITYLATSRDDARVHAVITGAGSGIGRAVAARLEADGWAVVGADVAEGADVRVDLSTREGNEEAVRAAVARHGRLDAVVPNAGVQHVAAIDEFPPEKWDLILALLLSSPFHLAREAWPHLRESGRGRLCVIASAHALAASPYKAAYVSAKHGVLGLVRTLALEGADAGIRATAVCPGFVRTPLMEGQIADQAKAHGMDEDRVLEDVILQPHAVKELIEPDEVAGVVAFLLSDAGRAFTGVPVTMDQGWTAR